MIKQTKNLNTGFQSRICLEILVSSAKGINRTFEIPRNRRSEVNSRFNETTEK